MKLSRRMGEASQPTARRTNLSGQCEARRGVIGRQAISLLAML